MCFEICHSLLSDLCFPKLMRCSYLGEPEKTRAALDEEGYYHTGDMVDLRDDELLLLGRERDDCKSFEAHYYAACFSR